MVKRIEMLAKQIETNVPGAKVDFTLFPSGAAMLDVKRAGRLFVLSYLPQGHFGVDEVRDGEGFLTSYRFTSEEFEPAAKHLLALLADAQAA